MNKKDVEIVCPCCESRLTVDLRTETVVRRREPESTDDAGKPQLNDLGWDSAFGRVRDRTSESADKLDSALDRERNRESDLEDLFRQARERASETDGDEA